MPKKKKDNILKTYMSKNDIFADIINYFIYDGKQVVKETDLVELDTTFVNENEEIFEKTRDLFKEATIKTDNKANYVLFGIENQTNIDSTMVARVLLYDALSYRKQFKNKNKNDIIKPVITIVIYYGKKKWDSPLNLHDMLNIEDKSLLKYIPNYHLNLIEPYQMNDNDIDKLKTDFKAICEYLKKSTNYEGIESIRKKKSNIVKTETIKLINYLTGSRIIINEEEDTSDMCRGFDEFEKRAIEKGKAEGKAEGLAEAERANIKKMKENGFDPETIARALSLDINYVKEVLAS